MHSRTIGFAACAALLGGSAVVAGPRDQPELAEAVAVETPDAAEWMKRLWGRFAFDGVVQFVESTEPDTGGAFQVRLEWSQPVVSGGKADCIGFANGPGAQCVVSVDWPVGVAGILLAAGDGLSYVSPKTQVSNPPSDGLQADQGSRLKPGMILVGLSPSSPGTIRFLLVDDRGLAQPGTLVFRGNAAIARPPCVNMPGMQVCARRFSIEARPESAVVFLTYGIRVEFLRARTSVPTGQGRSIERVEQLFDISFALRREPQEGEEPAAAVLPAAP